MKTATPTIGLLGGGQLARMMVLKAHELGLSVKVLSPHRDDPAAQVTQQWVQGDLNSQKDVTHFLKSVDVATFESEFLDADLLHQIQKNTKTKILPQPKTMGLLQDRLTQKISFEEAGLPTSPFIKVDSLSQLEQVIDEMHENFVLKKRRFGYDGYGTFIIEDEEDLQGLAKQFKETPDGFILEQFCPFLRELAFSAVRNKKGDITFLPLVETYQKKSRCLWVKGPVEHPAYKKLRSKVKKYLNQLDYVGIMAFELFDMGEALLINEIAPRVHNSAHYSLNALSEDQFSLHLKALFVEKLSPVKLLKEAFAMYNLLGTGVKKNKLPLLPEVSLHWYGKKVSREGRKMGHINATAETPEKALKKLKKVIKEYKL